MEQRTNKIFLYVGNRNTGKTDLIKNTIESMPQPKTLIVDIFDSPVWRNLKTWNHPERESSPIPIISPEQVKQHQYGLFRTFDSDTDYMQRIIANDVYDCSVILEDASRYFNMNLSREQKIYLLNSKQKNVDFHLVFHYLTDIAPRLVKMADYITLFKTGETKINTDKYSHPDFEKAFQIVANSKNRYENITLKLQ